jgi:hypothetical protein
VPAAATSVCFALILAGGQLAAYVPDAWLGDWTGHIVRFQTHFVDRFFPFDALWYGRIAADGYIWDPTQPHRQQDVAFFPLWPLMLRAVAAVVSDQTTARELVVLIAAVCAFASVAAFHRLALRLLPAEDARTACFLFALYPGASFLLLSYPTGLMNLLCILALLAVMDGRLWVAAAFSGLVTAAGPLGLGTGMTVCTLAALRSAENRRWREVPTLLGLCALAVSGLLAFIAWQALTLNDPLAFIKAQEAWAASAPWLQRIPRGFFQLLILPDFTAALGHLVQACRAPALIPSQARLEKSLHCAGLGLAIIALLGCLGLRSRPVLLQGAFTLLLFIWFHSTSRPGNSELRLTYCAVGMFAGMAWLLRDRPRLSGVALVSSAMLLFGGAFLVAAGYHVT